MPEGPEVETVKRVLNNWIEGSKIKNIQVYFPLMLHNFSSNDFNKLNNKTINRVERKGKILIFYIEDYILISHLAMEGKYHFYNENFIRGKHDHIVFNLDRGILVYNDTRKFGRFYLYKKDEAFINPPLVNLGLDPLDEIEDSYLFNKFQKSSKTLKELLLDQSILCGIGNIYADEICFDVKLLPYTKAKELSIDDCHQILLSAKKILNKAISLGGSSVHSFTSGNDVSGKFQNELMIYGRGLKKCLVCGDTISKFELGGRGTCFCSSCQNKINKKVRIIGVTGLIGSGKSSISNLISEYGFKLIDADKIAHEAYDDKDIVNQVREVFPKAVNDNTVDKRKLLEIINNSKIDKKKLEDIIHPYVINKIKNLIKNQDKYVLDVPLLFESNLNKICDLTVFVNISEQIRIKRLKERNSNFKEYSNLNNNIEEVTKKIRISSYCIDNSLDLNTSKLSVDKMMKKIIF